MFRYTAIARALALGLLTSTACTGIDGPDGVPGDKADDGEVLGEATERAGALLARIEDDNGSYVAWYEAAHPADEPAMSLGGVYPSPPIVHPAFLDRHGALDVFLAVAAPDEPVPPALLATVRARGGDSLSAAALGDRRAQLREANQALLRTWSFDASDDEQSEKATCSAAQKAYINGIYGDAYGHTATCGTAPNGFSSATWSYNYCNTPGGDCDYNIGDLGVCSGPTANSSCSFFQGHLLTQRGRTHATGGFDPLYNMPGHRVRFLTYNCGASTGNTLMRWRRGGGPLGEESLPPFHYNTEILGPAFLPEVADVRTSVLNAFWVEHVPQSGPTFLMNELRMYTDANEAGIMCADAAVEFEVTDETSSVCHKVDGVTIDFCDSPGSCNGCWE